MANLNAGAYNMTDRNLVLEIEDDFDLSEPNSRYVICGDNGVGKTSFLEKILIPVLVSNRLDFLYIGQDIRNQLYTLRALLATMGLSVIGADERELLRVWIVNSPTARVLIMDEFDKYFSDIGFIFQWTSEAIQCCFAVTHHEKRMHDFDPTTGGRIRRVRFERIGQDGALKRVRIRQEPS